MEVARAEVKRGGAKRRINALWNSRPCVYATEGDRGIGRITGSLISVHFLLCLRYRSNDGAVTSSRRLRFACERRSRRDILP